jgi:basic membrane protein A
MRKSIFTLVVVMVVLSLAVVACAGGATPAPEQPAEQPAAEQPAAEGKIKVCQITDTGGIDDKSFNATAWKGVQDAIEEYGVEGKYLESQQQTDYEKNMSQFLQEKCDLIITVGFLLGTETAKAAIDNPDRDFAIVDYSYPDCWPGAEVGKDCGSDKEIPNVLGLTFATDEAAFLAGYLAASQTETGKVGTWGGIQIPTVTIFMDGFLAGVNYHNKQKGTSVEVLGWDGATGLFTGDFEDANKGKATSESLADEGADIILPVAGPAGLGAGAAAKERGLVIIGVDADWYNTAPEYQDVELTSVLKNMDVTVKQAIKDVIDGKFSGGILVGTLENSGVGLAPFHNFEDKVSDEVKSEVDAIAKDIIAGKIVVADYLPAKSE